MYDTVQRHLFTSEEVQKLATMACWSTLNFEPGIMCLVKYLTASRVHLPTELLEVLCKMHTAVKNGNLALNLPGFLLLSTGFRDKDVSSRGLSTDSQKTHSRNLSDGSGSSQQGYTAPPPSGTRVAPLGRETTPTPNAPQRIPREVWDRFEGKTREVRKLLQLEFSTFSSSVILI